jgi:uncharacterized protein with von Willebrand factor type A (vWA) domain
MGPRISWGTFCQLAKLWAGHDARSTKATRFLIACGRFDGSAHASVRVPVQRVPISNWLNPAPRRHWNEPTIRMIRRVFPMYDPTINGLTEAVDVLRGTRPNRTLVN